MIFCFLVSLTWSMVKWDLTVSGSSKLTRLAMALRVLTAAWMVAGLKPCLFIQYANVAISLNRGLGVVDGGPAGI